MLKPTLPYRFVCAALLLLILSLVGGIGSAGAQVLNETVLSPADGWEFGNALASSGSTLVVGDQSWFRGPGHTVVGAAYVYTLTNGQWTQQARLTATDGKTGDLFGCSVAISGNTIVVGALQHGGRGAAYVFTLAGGQWTQQQELTAADGKTGDAFGCSVGVYNTTIAVGACHHGVGSAGAVYAFAFGSTTWTQQAEITHNPTRTPYALFGFSLALCPTSMVIGAPDDGAGYGTAYVTTTSGGRWSAPTPLLPNNPQITSQFGYSVAMYGNTAVVGAPGVSAAYVFTLSSGAWSQQAVLSPFEGASVTGFGTAIVLTANTLAVSAVNRNDIGAYIFSSNSSSGWTPAYEFTPDAIPETYESTRFGAAIALVGATVIVSRPLAASIPLYSFLPVGTVNCFQIGGVEAQANDQQYTDLFGGAVALSGNTMLAGAPGANGYAGAVFTYTRNGASLTFQTELTAANGQVDDGFGTSLAFNGTMLVVGAPFANGGTGAVYLYSYSSGVWTFLAELTASDGQPGDLFGNAVSLSGNTVAIGAPGQNNNTGAAYLFGMQGTSWSQQAELTAADGQVEDGFGTSVGLDGANLLVGSPNADTYFVAEAGAAYLFTLNGGYWTPFTKLFAADEQFDAQFGTAVAISGTNAAVGAPSDGSLPSKVYTFTQSASGWLLNSELNDGWMQVDQFGASLALSGNMLLVGAYGGNTFTGTAYLFSLNGSTWSLSSVFTATDGQELDEFGVSVALSGSSTAIGAPYAGYGGGSIYGF